MYYPIKHKQTHRLKSSLFFYAQNAVCMLKPNFKFIFCFIVVLRQVDKSQLLCRIHSAN